MCELCADGARSHAIAISHRPGVRLGGLHWSGSFAQAGSRAMLEVICAVRDFSVSRNALWKSPIVGLSNRAGDRLGYFAGIACDHDEALPSGFVHLDAPEMAVASSWHGPEDGEVIEHYDRMSEWLRGSGYRRVDRPFDRRDEYPHDVDFNSPPALRLLLPIERDR